MASEPSAKISDHIARAIARMPGYEQLGPQNQKLLTAMLGGMQPLEDALADLISKRKISTAEGIQLDHIGTILNLRRITGQSDDDYRAELYGRAGNLAQSGTTPQLIDLILLVRSDVTKVYTQDHQPATVEIVFVGVDEEDDDVDARILSALTQAKAAGVGLVLAIAETQEFLWGDSDDADVDGDLLAADYGFGDSDDADVDGDLDPGEGGGNLARLIT